ncbi:phosphoenolpyruvate--protein phosphotransferase [Bovifimicola ammoniilytica]|uniref:phosphoenolpyruvate--protein phosphotransferase n=1 Tax=Bovifimicola ammoniilytica TaxID=2981720 RepID=UPI00082193D5|nr:phosphoenolpyruvate--protein phosphotransferase [Bovifimicola ammoniilytica]MCU6754635.1 phosphoenolpyruvate--protein phosphotransferase [Bovifimicola ammoniilytica]SCJ87866.1 Phosphoenolpyruvate-protein phosphotransferase [uncultured Eubacterium sp.]
MEKFTGKSIFNGIAIGKILFYSKDGVQIFRHKVEDTDAEIARYNKAKEKAIEELNAIYEKAVKEVGEMNAAVFEVHAMMLEDDDYNDSVKNIITSQGVNAEYAVATTSDNFSKMFAEMDDEYFQARAIDIKDISERVLNILAGRSSENILGDEPVIVVANDLAPSETVQMDKEKLLAFVTEGGSSNSHTAILARTMNIPALIGIKIDREWNGKMAVVDGYNGELILEPDEATIKVMKERQEKIAKDREMLQSLKGKEDVTLDGKHIKLYANIGSVADVANVLKNDANGIGLFRSEFLYLENDTFPTENEQFQAYKAVAENMAGKKVVIRTLDIGADKQVDYFGLDKEDNPAMGYRAIRICLKQQDIFKTQLRALLRASAYGNISIMFPMIISVNEVRQIKAIVAEVKEELISQGITVGDVELGIMIETPAAVMISDLLAKEVDFFSIGTNDLTQYTLAIDRQNSKLDDIYDSHHEAILRMIRMVVENGHKNNCWVGICGELGADTTLTEEFIKMGIDELSVSPTFVLPIRKIIREIKAGE